MQLLITNYETLTRIRVGTVYIFCQQPKLQLQIWHHRSLHCIGKHGKEIKQNSCFPRRPQKLDKIYQFPIDVTKYRSKGKVGDFFDFFVAYVENRNFKVFKIHMFILITTFFMFIYMISYYQRPSCSLSKIKISHNELTLEKIPQLSTSNPLRLSFSLSGNRYFVEFISSF